MAAVDTYSAHVNEAERQQQQVQAAAVAAPPPEIEDAGNQTMWVFQSLRDALMSFTEIDFSEMISDGEDQDHDSDISEDEDEKEDEHDPGVDDEAESDTETRRLSLQKSHDDDAIERIGRFPTLAQLQETLRNASSFLTPPPPSTTTTATAPVELELVDTTETNENELTTDLESVGRFPTLQEMQAKLRNASNLFPRNGTSSLGLQQALQQYSLPSLDTYQFPKPLETFQKFWASYPQRPPTPRELLAKWSPAWAREADAGDASTLVGEPVPETEPVPDASELTEEEKTKSYGADGGLGCEHYLRNCKVQCPDCHKFYPCRLCHDEVEPHELRRKAVRNMLCMMCLKPQPAAEYCSDCNELMADYYCNVCKMWSDDPDRPIFHCDECGICRVGHGIGIDVFHCTKCGICMDLALENNHKCIVTKGPQSDCPICLDDLFQSTLPIVIMPCGHPIHRHCFDEYTKRYYRCPVCSRSVLNTSAMFRLLDEEISREVLPPELENVKVSIHCHDCGMRTRTPFHLAGLKCTTCGSYNTAKT